MSNTDSNDWLDTWAKECGYTSHPQDEWNCCAKDKLLAHISKHYIPKEEVDEMVRLAKLQMSANVFAQFKLAMDKQSLSSEPPKGTRFRTPLEELVLILEGQAPIAKLSTNKKGGE